MTTPSRPDPAPVPVPGTAAPVRPKGVKKIQPIHQAHGAPVPGTTTVPGSTGTGPGPDTAAGSD